MMAVAKQWFPRANPAGNKSLTKALACTMLQSVRALALCLCVALHGLMECCSAELYNHNVNTLSSTYILVAGLTNQVSGQDHLP